MLLTCVIGAVVIGVGQGIVVRQQATTGGTDIVAMLLQKFAGIKFSSGIFLADGFVVLSGLAVIGFGLGTGEAASNGWMLTLYSLITIYITSRTTSCSSSSATTIRRSNASSSKTSTAVRPTSSRRGCIRTLRGT